MAPSPQHSSSQVNLWATWIITSATALCSLSFVAGTFGDTLQTVSIGAGSNPSQLIVWNRTTYCYARLSSWAPRRTEGSQWRTTGLSGIQTMSSLCWRQLQTWVKAESLLKSTSLMLPVTSDLKSEIWARFFLCKTKEVKTTTKCLTWKDVSKQDQGSLGWVFWTTKPLVLYILYLYTSKHVNLVKRASILFLRLLKLPSRKTHTQRFLSWRQGFCSFLIFFLKTEVSF